MICSEFLIKDKCVCVGDLMAEKEKRQKRRRGGLWMESEWFP